LDWNHQLVEETAMHVMRWNGSAWLTVAELLPQRRRYTDFDLIPGVTYYYMVVAVNSVGRMWTNGYVAETIPEEWGLPSVQVISAEALTATSVRLSWTTFQAESVRLFRWSGSAWDNIATLPRGTNEFVDEALAADTSYYYHLAAYSPFAERWRPGYITVLTLEAAAPDAPTDLHFVPFSKTAGVLTWILNGPGERGVHVARWNGAQWQIVAAFWAGATGSTDHAMWPGIFYYQVIVWNQYGETWAESYLTAQIL
jgi:hypothetical protein